MALTLTATVCGCSSHHHVTYKSAPSDCWTGQKIAGTLCVLPVGNGILLTTNIEDVINDETWRNNYAQGYDQTNFNAEITTAIAKQLDYSGLFTKVVSGTNKSTDYYLSGTLTDFEVHGRANKTAEGILLTSSAVGSFVGMGIGMASTAGMKCEVKASIHLDDLTLKNKDGDILWKDSISLSTNYTAHYFEADPVNIFCRSNLLLKDAVNEMVRHLGNSMFTNRVSVSSR